MPWIKEQAKNELIDYHQDQLIIGGDYDCPLDFTVDRAGEEPHPQSQSFNSIIAHLERLAHMVGQTWTIQPVHMGEGQ